MTESSWIGKSLSGRYKIEKELGHGGMSSVYQATDPNLSRVVAIKLIHPHLSRDPEFVRRFETEATVVAKMRHPNILQVYDFNNDGENYYIVFEFVAGETLQDRMKRVFSADRLLPDEEIIKTVAGTSDALQYAHERDLIHRDIKPANIMIDVQEEPILMDFGISKIVGGTQHTATGAVLGTARYMSPEQIKGQRIDFRTDIYSLGVTLFEMVAGRPPYDADSAMTVMMMHVSDPIPDIWELRPEASSGLVSVIHKAMAKNPDDRYQTSAEMAQDLRNIGQGIPPAVAATLVEPGLEAAAEADMTVVEPVIDETIVEQDPAAFDATVVEAAAAAATLAAAETNAAVTSPSIDPVIPDTPTTGSEPAAAAPGGLANRPLLMVGGAVVAIMALLIIIGIIFVPRLLDGGGDEEGSQPTLAAVVEDLTQAAVEAEASVDGPAQATIDAAVIAATEETAAEQAAIEEVATEEAATGEALAAIEPTDTPEPTATLRPTEPPATATSTQPPPTNTPAATNTPEGFSVRITNISLQDGRYIVDYVTGGYTEQLPGTHVHFFFDTVSEANAGSPGSGPWILYGGPRPFSGYTAADRPGGANQMCALVANPDHSIQPGSGNCFTLPQ